MRVFLDSWLQWLVITLSLSDLIIYFIRFCQLWHVLAFICTVSSLHTQRQYFRSEHGIGTISKCKNFRRHLLYTVVFITAIKREALPAAELFTFLYFVVFFVDLYKLALHCAALACECHCCTSAFSFYSCLSAEHVLNPVSVFFLFFLRRLCVSVCVRNHVLVQGSTGNGLISELAQASRRCVVTTCHYHKHCSSHTGLRARTLFPFHLSLSLPSTLFPCLSRVSSGQTVELLCDILKLFLTAGQMLRPDFFVEPVLLFCFKHQGNRQREFWMLAAIWAIWLVYFLQT